MTELMQFFQTTGFAQFQWNYIVMIIIGLFFAYIGITKNFEPLLLIPIGFGMILGNMPGTLGVYDEGSVLSYLYAGVKFGIYPPLIFLGIGAMTDFSTLIANPKLIILGRFDRNHRRSRRTNLNFPLFSSGTSPCRTNSHCSLFLYVARTDNSATDNQAVDIEKRACHQNESPALSFEKRKDTLSLCRIYCYSPHSSGSRHTSWDAVFGQYIEREWCNRQTG